ncbi:alpha-1,2-fucosyltransferase [Seohaeicola nanhaiensis]|uniref:Alpha-1,2-fucosyltransferase n=1 Tax=Seohaeicola nanhaiensis TaxID=1387282 RepID=A0ABV9KD07_9RHOB
MITTRLHGRLGNQMFQYAAARGLAERLCTTVALDTRGAKARGEGVLTRVFDLSLSQPDRLPPDRQTAPLRYLIWRAAGLPPKLHRERSLGYNRASETWEDGSYLHGYWQSERYFAKAADAVRSAFTFPAFRDPRNKEMASRIAATLSISLHVRRGDYLTTGAHGTCDSAYYNAALERILSGLEGQPTVYVFSDDPAWARDNLPLPCDRVVVDFNGPDADYEDMRLMSLCQHNIIANSSFSWWAAWLNTTAGRRVAAPARWFADPRLYNPDLLPKDWIAVA